MIAAFIEDSSPTQSVALHIEEDALIVAGWWHAVIRLTAEAFIVRAEEYPDDPLVMTVIRDALSRAGFHDVGHDPLILAMTYTQISTAGGEWTLWGADPEAAREALRDRVTAESEPREFHEDPFQVRGMGPQLEGARRLAGLPPTVVVAVGIERDLFHSLEALLPECRFEYRSLGEIAPDACGELGPSAILVDTTTQDGAEFVMELRAAACGRFLPVAAVGMGTTPPLGADIVLDPLSPISSWRDRLRALLPD